MFDAGDRFDVGDSTAVAFGGGDGNSDVVFAARQPLRSPPSAAFRGGAGAPRVSARLRRRALHTIPSAREGKYRPEQTGAAGRAVGRRATAPVSPARDFAGLVEEHLRLLHGDRVAEQDEEHRPPRRFQSVPGIALVAIDELSRPQEGPDLEPAVDVRRG